MRAMTYETPVGRKSGGTKGVADGHLPHAGEKLDQTAVAKGSADDDVGRHGASHTDIDEGEQEGGEGESRETERGRVCDV